MAIYSFANIRMEKRMDKAKSIIKVEIAMKDPLRMIKRMAKVLIFGKTGKNMKASGKMIYEMVKLHLHIKVEIFTLDNFKMIN